MPKKPATRTSTKTRARKPTPKQTKAATEAQAPLMPAEHEMKTLVERIKVRQNLMKRKWGYGWTINLDEDVREKFDRAVKWALVAIGSSDVEWARQMCDQLLRGYTAVEGHLLSKGLKPRPPDLWEFTLEGGMEIFFAKTEEDKARAPNGKPVFTAEEVLVMLEKMPVVIEAKKIWKDAKVERVGIPFDDPIPENLGG